MASLVPKIKHRFHRADASGNNFRDDQFSWVASKLK
jgi:hypothetical protein